ncbi:MAG: EAL domain-containing protein [Bacillus sp. (in: Bacteria)]|nr:EAL domain-containing protein [Bacillus sp. (in: firmicutes)]
MEQLEKRIYNAESDNSLVAVFFLDLNNFKDVNDLMGHHFGDELLISVARKLEKNLKGNCFVARVSGDEFAIVQWNFYQDNEVIETGEELLRLFRDPFLVEGLEFYVRVSIGISLFPTHGLTPEDLLQQADLAMYNAKKIDASNYQVFTYKMEDVISLRKQLQKELESALINHEFELYYQPQMSMTTGEVVGVEALIRWNHPERGLLCPIDFIPMSEENGFIFTLDKWVLQRACEQFYKWKKEGIAPPLGISVNVSARQFYNKDLVAYMKDLMGKWKIGEHELTLEITEETLMTNKERAKAVLIELRKLGVITALDDFGTGYSSLSYLKFLPINKLKIDRSFMIDVTEDPRDGAILESMLSIAFHLNLSVIVEGVETKEQQEFLRSIGCNVAQGHYYSKALSSGGMTTLLKR